MKIHVRNLKKNYFIEGKIIPVLKGIDLSLESGDFVSLTGASGVGKSTLLHILGTLDAPTDGEVLLDGKNVFEQSSSEISFFRNKNIGFVFQFHHLLPEFSAIENVLVPLLIRRENKKLALKKAEKWLEQVGLSNRLHHKPGELSGGEQQRVALARALVNEPRLLLADEPTGNLDNHTGNAIFEILQTISREHHITVLLATHNPALAKLTPRHLILDAQKLHLES